MRRLLDVDLLDDAIMQERMAMLSMAILVVGVLLGVLCAVVLPHEEVGPLWFVVLVAASVAALPVHELVHAAAFKLVSGFRARVTFGFSSWMLYTSAPGCVLPKGPFCVVLMAPTVVVTALLLAIPIALGFPLLGYFLAIIHLAGCTGDMEYVHVIASEPAADLVEDTARGISLLSK
ncbi:MAG: DUF3267 domain-containing protein [Coriobacteriales bacterium]|nr:DUF3267 domain-containing protein [Coriobacteriales bacterium]